MIATHVLTEARNRHGRGAPSPRGAFTLTELLIVIALIVLLVALLLAALNQVQKQARKTSTLATMQAFRNACDAFQQEHGFYPGVVPEDILASDAAANPNGHPQISGTENALLHLMGGFVRLDDVGATEFNDPTIYPPAPTECAVDGWHDLSFTRPNGGSYDIKINLSLIGDGPIIGGKPYAPYLTPSPRELANALGTTHLAVCGGNPAQYLDLPDLIDAWGQPIIYLRRMRTIGPITSTDSNSSPQFKPQSLANYTASTELGRMGADQMTYSILNTATDPVTTLGMILGHPAMAQVDGNNGIVSGQARGAYMLLSAGPDGIYYSQIDGAGNPDNPQPNIIEDYPASIIEEYDDVLLFGGD